jgi:hypothetical protein
MLPEDFVFTIFSQNVSSPGYVCSENWLQVHGEQKKDVVMELPQGLFKIKLGLSFF